MSLEPQHFYEFGDFRLDPEERVLLRNGVPVPLTPKALQLLQILVENHGHIVDKEKLMSEIWAGSFVEDGNLAVSATILRKALDDNASDPTFIETVQRRGYRFIADVRLSAQSGGDIDNGTITDVSDPGSRYVARGGGKAKRLPLFFAAACVIVVVAIGFNMMFSPRVAGPPARRSIAVLPLKPINSTHREELYEIGIADALIHRLSSMKGLVVRPLNAVRKYGEISQDPLTAGLEQRVDYVLDSNYQLSGGQIRITAKLINVGTGEVVETYKNEKDANDIFASQDAIADEVGDILLAHFTTTASVSTKANRGTNNQEAYLLYLQGMYLANTRTAEDARKAVETLEQAVRLDPNYARAWAGKAYAHRAVGNLRRIADTHEEYRKSIEAINKALALDENLSEAYTALCENKMYYEYDFSGAEQACKRAIELDPSSSLAHQVYSRYLPGQRRFDEAIAEAKIVIDLEPASIFHQHMYGNVLYYARRYPEAAAQYKRVLSMDENYYISYFWLTNTLALEGKEAEAFEWFMRSLPAQNGTVDKETIGAFKAAFQTSGWNGVLRLRAKKFDESDEVYFRGAAYYAQIGDKDKAFEYLNKSFERRELWMSYLSVDPLMDPLRDDTRFRELLKRVEQTPD